MKLDHNKEFFNEKAVKWDKMVNHNPNKIRYLLKKLDIRLNEKVLDVGTGTGIMLPFLYEKVGQEGQIFAIDIAEKMLKQAQQKYPYQNTKYILGDVTDADLPLSYFDKIICYSVFPHFVDPSKTLSALKKYLKKNGELLICHSEGRLTINRRHEELGRSLISNILPLASDLAELLTVLDYKVVELEDAEELYYVIGVVQ